MDGVILINKESGYTSRDVVNLVGKYFHTKKIGHTGTLDPMAEGVLVLCVGKATKLVEVLTHDEKEYVAEITLGIQTDTFDLEGNIEKEEDVLRTKEEIIDVLNSFVGSYEQEVPIYSAVKIKGRKLYDYARHGEKIDLPKREVRIKELELIGDPVMKDGHTVFLIRTVVSKGTYIRALVRDIASKLNTYGMMSKLTRTRVGSFKIENASRLQDIVDGNYHVFSLLEVMDEYPKERVDTKVEAKIRNGMILENHYDKFPILFLDQEEKPLALYQQYEKNPTKIKPWKTFF